MSDEPELQPSTSSEWVTYLKQLMQQYGFWTGDAGPEFTDELAAAVRSLQTTYQISPADGVVRADTWAVLTGEQNSSPASAAASSPEPHDAGQTPAPQGGDQHGMTANPDAHAEQVPATFSDHGLPAFEFELPEIPVAEADFETPDASVHVELALTGSVQVKFPHPVEGVAVSTEGLEVEARHAVGQLNQGIQVGGLGGHELSIADTVGSQYGQASFGLDGSGAMVFSGSAQVHYGVPTAQGEAEVEGTIGYKCTVRVVPHPQDDPEPVQDEESWFQQHSTGLAAVGFIALAGAAIILTDGLAAPVVFAM